MDQEKIFQGIMPVNNNIATLSPYTLVKVVGNNRTKSHWIGKVGLVVGHHALGGWHKVFLDLNSTKPIVKIQRNALKVVYCHEKWENLVNQLRQYRRWISEKSKKQVIQKKPKAHHSISLAVSDLAKSFIWEKNNWSPTSTRHTCLSYDCLERLSDTSLEKYCIQFSLPLEKGYKRQQLINTILYHFQQSFSVNEEDTIVNFLSMVMKT
ncbi:hypothetical protein GpartN1_g7042.t1 [Galdieria partita]|uniref:Histone deacetylase complex subunit SAP30 Sin3 binding domain-containing protein n=1 Tax=Galdieria partita TaxID=83374 RepID=A0A9C7UTS4_9RHOD|nr:hypothetical protein GpartN1_g7042.t1 [Galdieria partita]